MAKLYLLHLGFTPLACLASQAGVRAEQAELPVGKSHLFHTAKEYCADNKSYHSTFDEEYWLRNWPEVCPSQSWLHSAKWLPHVLDEQNYLSICISLDFAEPHITNSTEVEEIRSFIEEMVYWWQLSLVGREDWRQNQRVPIKIFGVAMTPNVTLSDSEWTVYVNEEAACPDNCARALLGVDGQQPDYRDCEQSGNHFDMKVGTGEKTALAGHAGDRSIRIPWRTLESEMRGRSAPRKTLQQLGHASGLLEVPSLGVRAELDSIFFDSPTLTAFDCVMMRSLWAQHDPLERQYRRCHNGFADGVVDGCKACALCMCSWDASNDSVPCASFCADSTLLRPTTTTTTQVPDGLVGLLSAASASKITLVNLIAVLIACSR